MSATESRAAEHGVTEYVASSYELLHQGASRDHHLSSRFAADRLGSLSEADGVRGVHDDIDRRVCDLLQSLPSMNAERTNPTAIVAMAEEGSVISQAVPSS